MGMLAVWWSMYHGQNKTTASMLATAICLADEKTSVCATHTQLDMSDLEGMVNGRVSAEEVADIYGASGLNAVYLDFKSGILSKPAIAGATFKPDPDKRFYVLPGFERKSISDLGNDEDILEHVLTKEVKEMYDYLFVEVASGTRNSLTERIIKKADIVVVCLSQNAARIKEYFDSPLETRYGIDRDKVVVCFGGYRPQSRINYSNISLRYRIPCIAIPDNDSFLNAISDGNVHGFFLENERAKKGDNVYFRNKVTEGAKVLAKMKVK